jgi:hypothetical protein
VRAIGRVSKTIAIGGGENLMMLRLVAIATLCVLAGCSNPKSTVVPTSADKMETIKPAIEKLTPEERELFAGYFMRHTIGAAMGGAFGIKADPVPEGMTIGNAIEEQRAYLAKKKAEEAAAEELKKRVEAERQAKLEEFAKMISVALVSKRNSQGEYGQKFVILDVAFENKTDKDIQGVKGVLKLKDIFGDQIQGVRWSYDGGVAAKATAVEKGSGVKINQFMDKDMKLWNTDPDKIKATFEVSTILFKDGTRADAPEAN